MSTFVELHALRSFPPSNLNRDDLGTPKTAVFGGARRLRISSQCLKRTWRMSEYFRGAFAEEQLGVRTDRLPRLVLDQLGGDLDEVATTGLLALMASIGKKDKRREASDDGSEQQEGESSEEGPTAVDRTAHLLFLSRQEIDEVARFARENADALKKVFGKKSPNSDAIKKLREELRRYLQEHTSSNAVCVGLFGRFVTSDEIDTIEGALQVAHGLGTQKIEVEYDYFTTMDDLSGEAAAGFLSETEFGSSVFYLYSCCDLAQLERNLGARTKDGRVPDDEARRLARRSLPALVRAVAEATPKGKKTGTAPYTPAEYIEVVVRRGLPLSFANAFMKPVDAREEGGDAMASSITRLIKHRDCIETAYGRDKDVVGRFVLCLRDVDEPAPEGPKGCKVATIEDLAKNLTAVLDAMPPQAV